MKITIDIEAKEIAELRTLPVERLIDSKIDDAKKQILDKIVSAINSRLEYTVKLGNEN